jgi:hypothetical protein
MSSLSIHRGYQPTLRCKDRIVPESSQTRSYCLTCLRSGRSSSGKLKILLFGGCSEMVMSLQAQNLEAERAAVGRITPFHRKLPKVFAQPLPRSLSTAKVVECPMIPNASGHNEGRKEGWKEGRKEGSLHGMVHPRRNVFQSVQTGCRIFSRQDHM